MKRKVLLFVLLELSLSSFAEEPGFMKNENLAAPMRPIVPVEVPKPAQAPNTPAARALSLEADFKRARGLDEYEVQTLYFNRIACARHVYTSAGWVIDGDADLKITRVTDRLFEAEFTTYLFLGNFNPFNNGIHAMNSGVSKQLLNFDKWKKGQPLRLYKTIRLDFGKGEEEKVVSAQDEFRVLSESYPVTFLVKETVLAKSPFSLYFICQ